MERLGPENIDHIKIGPTFIRRHPGGHAFDPADHTSWEMSADHLSRFHEYEAKGYSLFFVVGVLTAVEAPDVFREFVGADLRLLLAVAYESSFDSIVRNITSSLGISMSGDPPGGGRANRLPYEAKALYVAIRRR